MSSRPGLPGSSAEDRPFTRAMRADGRPATLDDYVAAGGYEGLRRAIAELKPPEVTTLVTESGLRGRGGAGYSTGRKWSTMPLGPDAPRPKYIVCNGDEMEPGSFKDRFLMERNPHLLLEGMLLAGFATEADEGYIFLRAQYDASYAALKGAIGEARERGYLGEDVLGSGFSFDIELHTSIGRYICGEASAMLNALESQRPNPRARPPHMTGAGLFSRPTVVNNVESYMAVPAIVRHGVDWWKALSDHGRRRHQDLRRRRPGGQPRLLRAPDGRADAGAHRGARRRHAARVRAARRQPGRRLHVARGGARDRRAARLLHHGPGREPPRHRDARHPGRPDLPRGHDAQHDAVLRPGDRAAGARRAARDCSGWPRCSRTSSTGAAGPATSRCSPRAPGSWSPTSASATSRRARRSRWRARCACSRTTSRATWTKAAATTGATARTRRPLEGTTW